jgi:imidazolonepropionase-like amidohydrolase
VPTLVAHEAVSRLADAAITQDPALAVLPPGLMAGAWEPSDVMARAKWTPQILAQFKQSFPILQKFVGIYVRLGGRVAAGSDVGQAFVIPGLALHRELELLVNSGVSPAQAIRAATVDAAALLGLKDRVGVIDAGMAADFVLIDGDPLADIRNTRRIVAVVKDGVVVAGAEK